MRKLCKVHHLQGFSFSPKVLLLLHRKMGEIEVQLAEEESQIIPSPQSNQGEEMKKLTLKETEAIAQFVTEVDMDHGVGVQVLHAIINGLLLGIKPEQSIAQIETQLEEKFNAQSRKKQPTKNNSRKT